MQVRVIVVEDESFTRRAFALALKGAGFDAVEAADAFACRAAMKSARPDVVLIDLGLPGVDGLTLARELRDRSDIGLIVVSRRSEPEARIEALDLGVDDFLVKPVHLGELAARVRSVLRRRRAMGPRTVRLGAWRIDLNSRTAANGEHKAALTRGEFDLLARLIEGGGKIVSREELLTSISTRPDEADPRTVDALVSRLRRKLADGADGAALILTAPGFGYRVAQPVAVE